VAPQDRYWDTGPFLAWLNREENRLAALTDWGGETTRDNHD
jgi:hypothetical protein